jgi:TRAP-type uncharacterized transport system fused permease subunit
MGVPLLQAHLFPFIFAVFSHLTPPIAIGALVASQLAEAEYWPTSWEALKAASTAFLLPYLIVFAPVIVLRPDAGFIVSAIQIFAIPFGVLSLQIAFSSYFLGTVDRIRRVTFGITAFLFFATVFSRSIIFLAVALALFAFVVAGQVLKRRQLKAVSSNGELQESG